MNTSSKILLGTALWGWGVDESTALAVLDHFYERGGRWVDASVNYPINKAPLDFGKANRFISAWLSKNRNSELKVFCKIGAQDNLGRPDINLDPKFLQTQLDMLGEQFSEHLKGVGVHWDNRSDAEEIEQTVAFFSDLDRLGYAIGFSGVREPGQYLAANPSLARKWHIQVKENVSTRAAREFYESTFPSATYIAYGINMGGVKSNQSAYTGTSSLSLRELQEPEIVKNCREFLSMKVSENAGISDLNQLAMQVAYLTSGLDGLIVGARNVDQVTSTMNFWDKLNRSTSSGELKAAISSALGIHF